MFDRRFIYTEDQTFTKISENKQFIFRDQNIDETKLNELMKVEDFQSYKVFEDSEELKIFWKKGDKMEHKLLQITSVNKNRSQQLLKVFYFWQHLRRDRNCLRLKAFDWQIQFMSVVLSIRAVHAANAICIA